MVDFPRDNRFPTPGVDARFSTPGVDWRFKDAPADNRFPSPGIDRRWMGDPWNAVAPSVEVPISINPTSGPVGTRFLFALGITNGVPDPVPTYVLKFNGVVVSLDAGGGYTPDVAGTLEWSAVWSNGIDPDAEELVTAEVEAVTVAPTVITEPKWLFDTLHAGSLFTADIGSATGSPEPTSTVLVTFNGDPIEPVSPGVWQTPSSGNITLQVTWSNGIAPDLVLTATQESW